MDVCAYFEHWPIRDGEWRRDTAIGEHRVSRAALPWTVIAEHVSHLDVSGAALRSSLDNAGLSLEAVELSLLTCLDPAAFEQQTDDAYMQMQIAERLGARLAIIASAHRGSAGWETTADALTRLAALAERMDLKLCIRNANGSALEQPDDLHALFARVGSAALALCLDGLEFQRAVVNPADAVLSFGPRLAAVRLRDAGSDGMCEPGRGSGHVVPTLRALRDEGFRGPLICDSRHLPPPGLLAGVLP